MTELKIIRMSKDKLDKIIKESNDINKDCLWDFPFDELDYIMESSEDMELDERTFAMIGKRLYELPEDYNEVELCL